MTDEEIGFDPDWKPDCLDCRDSGKIVAANGHDEYLGYDYIPCHCIRAQDWLGKLVARRPEGL